MEMPYVGTTEMRRVLPLLLVFVGACYRELPNTRCDFEPNFPGCPGTLDSGDAGSADASEGDAQADGNAADVAADSSVGEDGSPDITASLDGEVSDTTDDSREAGNDATHDGSDSDATPDGSVNDATHDGSVNDATPAEDTMVAADARVCVPNVIACNGDALRRCNADGLGWTILTSCPAGTCSESAGRCTACTPGMTCAGQQLVECDAFGATSAPKGAACPIGTICDAAGGQCDVCQAGAFFCVGKNLRQCAGDGQSSSLMESCVTSELCSLGGAGGCATPVCTPAEKRCNGNMIQTCNAAQTGWTDVETCAAPTSCGGSGTQGVCGGCGGVMPGPLMTEVSGYCIDSTEVTQAQYKLFVDAKAGDATGQDGWCSSNSSYVPVAGGCGSFDPAAKPSQPVTCVDWCDAFAYCKWAGKRLCGDRGGGALPYFDQANAARSQWFNACSAGATNTYPYGSTWQSTYCNIGYATMPLANVGSFANCRGASAPYSAMFDMSGNAGEWEDSCFGAGAGDNCRVRGGSVANTTDPTKYGKCAEISGASRLSASADVGFRCCAK